MAVVQSTPHPSSLCLSIDKPQYSSAEPLDTCQLAKLIYSGTTNFHRQFTQILGVTPNEYITTIRLNAARKLLEETDQLVADIATAVGFYDQSHFTKAFKKARGLPPGAYRRQHRKRWTTHIPPTQAQGLFKGRNN